LKFIELKSQKLGRKIGRLEETDRENLTLAKIKLNTLI
jgi:hypothetical protein